MRSKAFKITIEEVLTRTIIIEAETMKEAVEIAKDSYSNGEVVLDGDDYDRGSFKCESQGTLLPDECPFCNKPHEFEDGIDFVGHDGKCLGCGCQIVE